MQMTATKRKEFLQWLEKYFDREDVCKKYEPANEAEEARLRKKYAREIKRLDVLVAREKKREQDRESDEKEIAYLREVMKADEVGLDQSTYRGWSFRLHFPQPGAGMRCTAMEALRTTIMFAEDSNQIIQKIVSLGLPKPEL